MPNEMNTRYQPEEVEEKIYKKWAKKNNKEEKKAHEISEDEPDEDIKYDMLVKSRFETERMKALDGSKPPSIVDIASPLDAPDVKDSVIMENEKAPE